MYFKIIVRAIHDVMSFENYFQSTVSLWGRFYGEFQPGLKYQLKQAENICLLYETFFNRFSPTEFFSFTFSLTEIYYQLHGKFKPILLG